VRLKWVKTKDELVWAKS